MTKKYTKYRQGKFIPQNKEKYKGKTKILYRSSWERNVCIYLDMHPNCVSWNFESVFIRYNCPLDKKDHRYILDFQATFRIKGGGLQTYLIEVKPAREVVPPKNSARLKPKNYMLAVAKYKKNLAKWKAAKAFAKRKGYKFIILTENELFKK